MKFLIDNLEYLFGIITAISVIFFKFRKLYEFVLVVLKKLSLPFTILFKVSKALDRLENACHANDIRFESLQKDIEIIRKELTTNGGSSIKDAIIEIKKYLKSESIKTNILLNESEIMAYHCNEKGQTVWVSDTLAKLYKMAPQDMYGNGWMKALHVDDVEKVAEHYEYCLKNKIPYKDNYRIVSNNFPQELETSSQYIHGSNGEILGLVGIVKEKNK